MNRKGFYFDEDPGKGGDPPTDPPADPPKDPPNEPNPKVIAYDRFQEVYDKAKKLEDQLKAITDAQKKADEDKLKEENKWKDLYEKTEKEKAEKEKELLRLRVASKKDLPGDLVEFLKGETEQELEASADKLLTYAKVESPGVPRKKLGGSNTPLDIKTMTPEEIRKNSAALMKQAKAQ